MTQSFSEDDLRAFVAGDGSASVAAEIEDRMKGDPALRAEIAVMRGLARGASDESADFDELGWRRLEKRIKAEQAAQTPVTVPNFWRIAAVVCGFVVLAQGAFIAVNSGSGAPAQYQTSSGESARFVLAIAFENSARIDEITTILQRQGGTLVGGPGASGLYRVDFGSASARAAAQDVLSGSALVRLVAQE